MLLLRGRSRITREAGAIRQTHDAAPGMLWLTPADSREDLIEISSPLPEALHVFLPATQFGSRGDGYNGDIDRLRYEGGFRDPLLEPINHASHALPAFRIDPKQDTGAQRP